MSGHDLRKLEYPRHLHKPSIPGEWVYVVVKDPEDCARRLAEGWSLTPILLDPAAPAPAEVQAPEPAPVTPPPAADPASEAEPWTVEVPDEALEVPDTAKDAAPEPVVAEPTPIDAPSAPAEPGPPKTPRRRPGRPRKGQAE